MLLASWSPWLSQFFIFYWVCIFIIYFCFHGAAKRGIQGSQEGLWHFQTYIDELWTKKKHLQSIFISCMPWKVVFLSMFCNEFFFKMEEFFSSYKFARKWWEKYHETLPKVLFCKIFFMIIFFLGFFGFWRAKFVCEKRNDSWKGFQIVFVRNQTYIVQVYFAIRNVEVWHWFHCWNGANVWIKKVGGIYKKILKIWPGKISTPILDYVKISFQTKKIGLPVNFKVEKLLALHLYPRKNPEISLFDFLEIYALHRK